MFWQLLANGLVTGSVIAIAAVGVSLVYGILRLVNFAYGDFMAFGALAAYAFNGPLGLGMIPSTLLGMVATAVLSLVLDVALWRPLRARRAGFMSLFLASIGLALVLRQALLLAYGPQPQTYKVDQYKVYVIGSVRLSEAQFITIVVAAGAIGRDRRPPLAHDPRPDDARARRRPGARGDRGHPRRSRDHVHVDPLRPARRARGRARRARPVVVRPELRLPAPAAGLRRGRARRDRQRLRRARRRARRSGSRWSSPPGRRSSAASTRSTSRSSPSRSSPPR